MNNNIIKFDKARFTVLTEQLIRIEYSHTGEFEDGMTQMIQNRDFPEVKFDFIKKESTLEIITSTVHLYYSGGEFTNASLFADVKFNFSVILIVGILAKNLLEIWVERQELWI